MNRSRDQSAANRVRVRIQRGGGDRLWTYPDFPSVDRMVLAATLSRLVKVGDLVRVRRGVYYQPKPTRWGSSRPDPEALVDAILRASGIEALPSGGGEYNRLGLTTQMSGAITRAAPRRVRRTGIGSVPPDIVLRTAERPLDKQIGIRADERTALDALRDIARIPDTRPREVMRRLLTLLQTEHLSYGRLAKFALVEPPRVRALLGALGDQLSAESRHRVSANAIKTLRDSLNPLTRYVIPGLAGVLRYAAAWHITDPSDE